MAKENISVAPYYDSYNPNSDDYIQLLALPGRVAQSREFSMMQSILRNIIKSIGDGIFSDGNIIEGCDISITSKDPDLEKLEIPSDKLLLIVDAGKVYVEGIVMSITRNKFLIPKEGKLIVGVILNESIIKEGPELRDPAQGFDNYNQSGCHRLRRWLEVVVGKKEDYPEAYELSTITDGVLDVKPQAPEFEGVSQLLATRTYEESGSYIVKGLKVKVDTKEGMETPDEYSLIVEEGIAYVEGFRVPTGGNRRVIVQKQTEPIPSSATATYREISGAPADEMISGIPEVKDITSVIGYIGRQISTSETRPTISGNSIVIVNITSTRTGGTVYKEGTDYTVSKPEGVSADNVEITWITTPPTSYFINYNEIVTFDPSTYSLVYKERDPYLVWKGETHPVVGTSYTINYNSYLARKDLLCIYKSGAIELVKGVPARYGKEMIPETPDGALVLAIVENPPNGSASRDSMVDSKGDTIVSDPVVIENIGLTRFTMQDIQSIVNRVQTMQYDIASTSLDADAGQVWTENRKKGIFTDPLVDLSRIDYNYIDDSIDKDKPLFDMAIDFECNMCYLPIVSNIQEINYDESINNGSTLPKKYKRLMTLKSSGENSVRSQNKGTGTITINPYSTFPQTPEVSIDPSTDSWFDDTIIEVPLSLTEYDIVSTSSRTVDNRKSNTINNSNYRTKTTTNTITSNIGVRVSDPVLSSSEIISERAITYIRQREITIEGANFSAGADNIECYFDNVRVDLVPFSTNPGDNIGIKGTAPGTMKANEEGYMKAKFTIPKNVFTGIREVRLKTITPEVEGITKAENINEGFTLYIAEGISRTIRNTVTTVTTILQERITESTLSSIYVDPVGQTFVLDRESIIKGIDVFFSNVPTARIPVTCEIRGVTNGTIDSTVYAHKSLYPEDIIDKVDSVKGSKATRFEFDDPVLLEGNREYAFVLRSTSNSYSVWVAELGGIDKETESIVVDNPYMTGVMFSSSNNSTWTSHQTMDLKFNLIEDVYDKESIALFTDIPIEAARLYLHADSIIPKGTSVLWEYSLVNDTDTSYKPITPYNIIQLDKYYDKSIRLKVTIRNESDANISPMIALDTVGFTTSYYDTEGWYVSRYIPNLDPYTNVKIIVEAYEPVKGKVISESPLENEDPLTFYISKDAATSVNNKIKLTHNSKEDRTLLNGWVEKTYEVSGLEVADELVSESCRVFIHASSEVKYKTPAFRKLRVVLS